MGEVIVLGGGIVGVTTGLALLRAGRDVTIVDRGPPAHRSSFGNAGIIQVEAAEPYAMPRSMRELTAIALRHSNAVNWHWDALPSYLMPLWKYFRHSRPSQHHRISQTYAQLTSRASSDHALLIDAADAWSLIRQDGFRYGFRDPSEMAAGLVRAERFAHEYNVNFTALDGAALCRAEPNLKSRMAGAIHWTDSWTCRDPGALVTVYTDLFVAKGGRIQSGDAMTLDRRDNRWTVAVGERARRIEASDVVVCLGFESARLCRRFGLRIPLFCKRGYHQHYATGLGPELLFVDTQYSAVLAPMTVGLRILSGAEIALRTTAPTPVQLDRAVRAARDLFDIGEPLEQTPWVGNRPCMPDMLPVVGAVSGHPGLWTNFGHGHQGFTLGPTTATLLSEEISGNGMAFSALSPDRHF